MAQVADVPLGGGGSPKPKKAKSLGSMFGAKAPGSAPAPGGRGEIHSSTGEGPERKKGEIQSEEQENPLKKGEIHSTTQENPAKEKGAVSAPQAKAPVGTDTPKYDASYVPDEKWVQSRRDAVAQMKASGKPLSPYWQAVDDGLPKVDAGDMTWGEFMQSTTEAAGKVSGYSDKMAMLQKAGMSVPSVEQPSASEPSFAGFGA